MTLQGTQLPGPCEPSLTRSGWQGDQCTHYGYTREVRPADPKWLAAVILCLRPVLPRQMNCLKVQVASCHDSCRYAYDALVQCVLGKLSVSRHFPMIAYGDRASMHVMGGANKQRSSGASVARAVRTSGSLITKVLVAEPQLILCRWHDGNTRSSRWVTLA